MQVTISESWYLIIAVHNKKNHTLSQNTWSVLFSTGYCITRVRPGDMCPISAVAYECAPNTPTATVCQCDQLPTSSGDQGTLLPETFSGSGIVPALEPASPDPTVTEITCLGIL